MKMMYQKLVDNPVILGRNLKLFSKMIKYETMMRNIHYRNEVEKFEARRILQDVEDSMRGILRAQNLSDQDLDHYSPMKN
mmetsp:Transcript_23274/g.31076  ORF Transcript_23274/g.31076 Transcript_23274/m.31076 type:complete len:80 (+) Transcript_23274:916-1155(+)